MADNNHNLYDLREKYSWYSTILSRCKIKATRYNRAIAGLI